MRNVTILVLAFSAAMFTGCAAGDPNADFISKMDSLPPDQQLPNWATTRELMMRQPPNLGEMAPDFTLKSKDGDATTRLSQFRGDRPVVLVFGSWT